MVALAGAGVASISRSSAFISSALSGGPTRTEWWQASVPQTWSSRRPSACAPSSAARSSARSRTRPARSPPEQRRRLAHQHRAGAEAARPPGRARRARRQRVDQRRPRPGRDRPPAGTSRICRATPPPRAGASASRRRCRSCAACWSTMTMPSARLGDDVGVVQLRPRGAERRCEVARGRLRRRRRRGRGEARSGPAPPRRSPRRRAEGDAGAAGEARQSQPAAERAGRKRLQARRMASTSPSRRWSRRGGSAPQGAA